MGTEWNFTTAFTELRDGGLALTMIVKPDTYRGQRMNVITDAIEFNPKMLSRHQVSEFFINTLKEEWNGKDYSHVV